MTAPRFQADLEGVLDLLLSWIGGQADEDEIEWLREKVVEVRSDAPRWKFFTSFSAVPRFVRKVDLEVDESDLEDASTLRHGWTPAGWSLDEAGRAVLVLSLPVDDRQTYLDTVDQIFSTADVRESVALYRLLPLYPFPDAFRARAAEGLRSNMTSVFNAVAHDNPYPAEYLDETAWNQMVLKALFIGSPLHRIQGLDDRANPELARMLIDYAHERQSAGRSVSPELWRPVGPFAGDEYVDELRAVLGGDDAAGREAAALALADAATDEARSVLDAYSELAGRIRAGELTWESFSRTRMPVPA